MDYSWELLILLCAYITVFSPQAFSVRADDEKRSSESNTSAPTNLHGQIEWTTESSSKKKNAILDLKNNNILRDKDAHSSVTENVKSLLDDIMKSSAPNTSDSASENSEPEHIPSHPTESSYIDRGRKPLSNILDVVPRNVRDLIPDSGTVSNSTDSTVSNATVTLSKENTTSFNNRSDGGDRTSSVSEVDITSNRITTDTLSSTSAPPSPKIRDKTKPKPDMNPKQFKKPSINLKNKPHVITNNNVSVEAIKPENITEYATDQPMNDNLTTDRMANVVTLAVNGTSQQNSGNATVSSLKTPPESESWAPLTVMLIGAGVVALISVVTAIGMFSVVLYRRYHWNKPQTFSDKCSNADSTGYIDDSTLKENSEEMYSLDNDSFLNSLEAMTIQNYWADSIRHTKL